MKIMLEEVPLAFADALFEPKAIGDGEPAYSCRFIIEPGSKNAKLIEQTIKDVAEDKWGEKAEGVLEGLFEDGKVALEKKEYRNKKTREVYDGFEGKWSLGTRRSKDKPRPTTFDENRNEVGPSAGKHYSGAIVDASVEIWAQDNTWGRRINAEILGCMFVKHGKAFGGGGAPASADDFKQRESAGSDDLV